MRIFLNVWWHLTLGFVLALAYAVMGLFYCCTVILFPVGLGWLQFAKFLLAPHTSAMVPKSDLALLTGKSQGTAMKTYSLIIRILYFPFGLVASLGAIGMTVGYCITIIGIPSGLVWARSLSTIFNPVNKVCVPRFVAEEIERIKAGNTVSRYSGQQPSGAAKAAGNGGNVSARASASLATPASQVRSCTMEKLEEIIASPEMYKAELVDAARHEIEVRSKAEGLKEKTAEFDDAKLQEILSSSGIYSDELVYACSIEKSRRDTEREIRMKEEQEAARIKAEQEEEAKRQHRIEAWTRVRPYVFAGAEDNTGRAWVYCPDVVREYADHLESGDLQPYIPKNFVKAAALYEKSWKADNRLKAGALYYKAHLYNDARKIFEEYPDLKVSNGYIGMMYLYGKGGFEQDCE